MSNQIISPLETGAGGLGRTELRWGDVYANALNGSALPATGLIGALPGTYVRDQAWAIKVVSVAADRYILLSPHRMAVDVNGSLLALATQQALDLSLAATWDSTSPTDYTVAANRAGKNYSVYACLVGGVVLKLLVSANATAPTGYTTLSARKVAGFHCLCANVGTISGHPLSGYLAGDILPDSVWDLKFRPVASPEGMVYVAGIGRWVDIYLASVSGGALVSVNGGTIADGTSATAFDWYDFAEWFGRIKKRLPTQAEFMAAASGSNEATALASGADPVTTGGHVDTAGTRMISNVGCEDCCGAMWQWGNEPGGPYGAASWTVQYGATRTLQRGSGFNMPNRSLLGGGWSYGTSCGSRGSLWVNGPSGPLFLSAPIGARGVSEPLAVGA